ncbi:MAG: cytochrome P450, partial [Ilumatobacteraceae bacterium]
MPSDSSHLTRIAKELEPAATFRHLREQCPLYRDDDHDPPYYVLSRFADVVEVLKSPQVWGNRDGPGIFYQEKGVLGSADNPDHARHRRILQSAFVPTAIARLESAVAAIADELFDEMAPRGEGDFVELFATPFPAIVIGELLGVRAEDRVDFERWSLDAVAALTGGDLETYAAAKSAIEDCIEAQVDDRERMLVAAGVVTGAPAGDAAAADPLGSVLPADVSSIMCLAVRDGLLSREEMRHVGYQLLVAGHETTSSRLSLFLPRLVERPQAMATLRADPA